MSYLQKELEKSKAQMDELFSKDVEGENDLAELTALEGKISKIESALKQPVQPLTSPISETIVAGYPAVDMASVSQKYLDTFGTPQASGFNSFKDWLLPLIHGQASDLHVSAAASGFSSGSGADGGFLVPDEYSSRIIAYSLGESLLSFCNIEPMASGQKITAGFSVGDHQADSGPFGISAEWPGEGSGGTDQNSKLMQIALCAYKLLVATAITREISEDMAPQGITAIQRIIQMAVAWAIDKALISGTGAGQPLGILNANSLIEISKEDGQSGDTIVYENVLKMWQSLYSPLQKEAIWIINPNCFTQLSTMTLNVGTAGALTWHPVNGTSPLPTLLGRPIYWSEHAKTLGDAGDIILVAPSQLLVGMRSQISLEVSPHAKWDTDEIAMRSVCRMDARQAWNDTLTDASGNEVSWAVALAER